MTQEELSESKKGIIAYELLEKKTGKRPGLRELARDLEIPSSTVASIKRRILAEVDINGGKPSEPKNLANKKRSGRPNILTVEDIQRLVHAATCSPLQRFKPWSMIIKETRVLNGGTSTKYKALHSAGLGRYVPAKKCLLDNEQRERRLAYATQQIAGLANEDHHRMLFSDESSVVLGRYGVQLCTRTKDEKYHPDCVQLAFKKASSFMVWGVIGYNYKGPLLVFKKRTPTQIKAESVICAKYDLLEGDRAWADYCQAFEDADMAGEPRPEWKLPGPVRRKTYKGGIDAYVFNSQIIGPGVFKSCQEFQRLIGSDKQVIFMQDLAPSHNSIVTRKVFQRARINLADWPANSPDMNPIESIWQYMKRRIASVHGIVTHRATLTALWEQEWALMPQEVINHQIDKYESKLQKVVELEGGNGYSG